MSLAFTASWCWLATACVNPGQPGGGLVGGLSGQDAAATDTGPATLTDFASDSAAATDSLGPAADTANLDAPATDAPAGAGDGASGPDTACTPPAACGQPGKACTHDTDCIGFGKCNALRHLCVPCMKSTDCPAGQRCRVNACVAATLCTGDVQCKAVDGVCNKIEGFCVACQTSADCKPGQVCADENCVPACTTSKDCAAVCDSAMSACLQCMAIGDCPPGQVCSADHKCIAPKCKGDACAGAARFQCAQDGLGYKLAITCATPDNPCQQATCDPSDGCGIAWLPAGTACGAGKVCGAGGECK
ncbi:MAG: hypothetical protein EXR79_14275 [Myxococcales bacterium]|nr:hypothetical protein [Myxococcales bacterium]